MASIAPDGEVENIQEYMKTVSQQLSAVAQGQVDAAASLLPVCIALHQELIQELAGEDGFDIHERSPLSADTSAGIRPSYTEGLHRSARGVGYIRFRPDRKSVVSGKSGAV